MEMQHGNKRCCGISRNVLERISSRGQPPSYTEWSDTLGGGNEHCRSDGAWLLPRRHLGTCNSHHCQRSLCAPSLPWLLPSHTTAILLPFQAVRASKDQLVSHLLLSSSFQQFVRRGRQLTKRGRRTRVASFLLCLPPLPPTSKYRPDDFRWWACSSFQTIGWLPPFRVLLTLRTLLIADLEARERDAQAQVSKEEEIQITRTLEQEVRWHCQQTCRWRHICVQPWWSKSKPQWQDCCLESLRG